MIKASCKLNCKRLTTLSTIEIFNVQNCAFTLFLFPLLPFSRALSRIRLSCKRLSFFACKARLRALMAAVSGGRNAACATVSPSGAIKSVVLYLQPVVARTRRKRNGNFFIGSLHITHYTLLITHYSLHCSAMLMVGTKLYTLYLGMLCRCPRASVRC